jgi:predicted nuclease with TOPRIM domain
MTNPIIETDLANILNKLDQKLDKIDEKFEKKLDILSLEIKSNIKSLESKIEQRFDKVDDRLNKLEIGQADLKGDIKALDAKTEQLDKRLGNVEFANRGILVGLVIVILGGAVKLFGSGS